MERRRYTRHDLSALAAAVAFHWKNAEGILTRISGTLGNISTNGLFIFTDYPPPIGTKLSVEMDITTGQHSEVLLKAKAQVNRVEKSKSGKSTGFAATTGRMKLSPVQKLTGVTA